MKDFIEYLVKHLVDKPEEVNVTEVSECDVSRPRVKNSRKYCFSSSLIVAASGLYVKLMTFEYI